MYACNNTLVQCMHSSHYNHIDHWIDYKPMGHLHDTIRPSKDDILIPVSAHMGSHLKFLLLPKISFVRMICVVLPYASNIKWWVWLLLTVQQSLFGGLESVPGWSRCFIWWSIYNLLVVYTCIFIGLAHTSGTPLQGCVCTYVGLPAAILHQFYINTFKYFAFV